MSSNLDSRFLLSTPTPLLDDRYRERDAEISTSRRFRTLLYLLSSDKSDGDDDDRSSSGRWRSFKERLGFPLLGCCASAASRRESSSPIAVAERDEEEDEEVEFNPVSAGGMSLAEALSAEREFRITAAEENSPERVSLMRLLEAAEMVEREREKEEKEEEKEAGNDSSACCCVCMVRKKGAAIIPCGHTFCRVCSKEVWMNRGSCPLCNRLILDVLNIF